MSAVAADLIPPSPEHVDQRVVLRGVGWEDYENLLAIRGESSGTRFTYTHGVLELMTPSINHESHKKTLARLIEAYAEEREIEMEGFGSWTLKIRTKNIGIEPDECYLLGPLTAEPVLPDLAIEVVWTSGGLDKLEVYRELEVPEVWFWERSELHIFLLHTDAYQKNARSKLLPDLDPELLAGCMRADSQTAAVRKYRAALRAKQ